MVEAPLPIINTEILPETYLETAETETCRWGDDSVASLDSLWAERSPQISIQVTQRLLRLKLDKEYKDRH